MLVATTSVLRVEVEIMFQVALWVLVLVMPSSVLLDSLMTTGIPLRPVSPAALVSTPLLAPSMRAILTNVWLAPLTTMASPQRRVLLAPRAPMFRKTQLDPVGFLLVQRGALITIATPQLPALLALLGLLSLITAQVIVAPLFVRLELWTMTRTQPLLVSLVQWARTFPPTLPALALPLLAKLAPLTWIPMPQQHVRRVLLAPMPM